MQTDLRNTEKAVKKLNKAVDDLLAQDGDTDSPLIDKQHEMNHLLRETQATACEKENRLQDAMRQVFHYSSYINVYISI